MFPRAKGKTRRVAAVGEGFVPVFMLAVGSWRETLMLRRRSDTSPWNTGRATLYGAAIGAAAAGFKLLAPWNGPHSAAADAAEIVGASLAFALLCGLAAALRNFIVRRLVVTRAK